MNAKGKPENDHILVYQTSKTNHKLFPALKEVSRQKFIIYGFDIDKTEDNLIFKKTSVSDSFVKDLSTAKAIITNGGFSLISEGLFLQKPILSNPVHGQFEQILNATHIEKMGYGLFVEKIDSDSIKLFLRNIERYKENLKKHTQKDNKLALSEINKKIDEVLNIR